MTGAPVKLYERVQATAGTPPAPVYDDLNDPVYTYATPVTVANVLIGQPSTDEVTSSISLYGKKAEFMLGIPKGDTHDWEDAKVEFFGETWQVFGTVIQGIEANVPTPWHHKVRVCRYE